MDIAMGNILHQGSDIHFQKERTTKRSRVQYLLDQNIDYPTRCK